MPPQTASVIALMKETKCRHQAKNGQFIIMRASACIDQPPYPFVKIEYRTFIIAAKRAISGEELK